MLRSFLSLLRMRQWLKNLMLYFPPFLGGTLFSLGFNRYTLFPFCAFCLVSSAMYICNDVFDQQNDRHHPDKRTRAIASGRISIASALLCAATLLVCSLMMAWNVSNMFLTIMLIYVVISLAYSVKLKEIVLLDVCCISACFLLRLQAGGVAFNVAISEWLFASVFLLSVFLSTGKRLAEKQSLGEHALSHRKTLMAYPKGFLEAVMYLSGCSVLVTYTMFTISRHSLLLLFSVPLCCFGLLCYLFRIRSGKSGDPTESLVSDLPLLIVGIIWVCMVGWGIYGG